MSSLVYKKTLQDSNDIESKIDKQNNDANKISEMLGAMNISSQNKCKNKGCSNTKKGGYGTCGWKCPEKKRGEKKRVPSIYYNIGSKKVETRAAGVLFYKIVEGVINFLLRYNKSNERYLNRPSDIGGKIEKEDKQLIDTVLREVSEETNGKLFDIGDNLENCKEKLQSIFDSLGNKVIYFYIPNSKYIVYLIEMPLESQELSLERFGPIELNNNKKHSFEWVSNLNSIKSLHPRIDPLLRLNSKKTLKEHILDFHKKK